MKFTVDVEDFYLEEEDIAGTLKSFIGSEIAAQIYRDIKDKVSNEINNNFKDYSSESIKIRVDTLVNELVPTHRIKHPSYMRIKTRDGEAKEDVSIKEYIEWLFDQQNIKASIDSKIEKICENYAKSATEQFKQRYDMLFAAQLVQKMNEVGMLKENVASILLNKSDESIS